MTLKLISCPQCRCTHVNTGGWGKRETETETSVRWKWKQQADLCKLEASLVYIAKPCSFLPIKQTKRKTFIKTSFLASNAFFWPSQQQRMGIQGMNVGVQVATLLLGNRRKLCGFLTPGHHFAHDSNYREVSRSPFSIRLPFQHTKTHKATWRY